MNEPTHLDLFSGIGGFALAAQWAGFRTIGFCEIDKYCQKVLAKNFMADTEGERESSKSSSTREGILESAGSCRIFSNIFDLDGRQFTGVSLITGGFPCQPFSVAGKRRGAADDRAIWPEMFRVIREARPAWILGENVPGIMPMELDNVLSDLEGIGYATRSFVIPACAVDARHRRDRLWIVGRFVGDAASQQDHGEWRDHFPNGQETALSDNRQTDNDSPERPSKNVADDGEQQRNWWLHGTCRWPGEPLEALRDAGRGGGKADGVSIPESLLGRVAHGIPSRVDRLKGLGNAIVPQVAYEILREIRNLI